jgi:CheY-like chemotaxis protein
MPRILIVDDQPAILTMLSHAFTGARFDVTTASSGEEAVDLSEGDCFDVVLSDVTMPGMDGHQTVSRIRARHPHTVAVLMSGFHIACTGACCVEHRHCTWLQKPFLPRDAVNTIKQLLSEGVPARAQLTSCRVR